MQTHSTFSMTRIRFDGRDERLWMDFAFKNCWEKNSKYYFYVECVDV